VGWGGTNEPLRNGGGRGDLGKPENQGKPGDDLLVKGSEPLAKGGELRGNQRTG